MDAFPIDFMKSFPTFPVNYVCLLPDMLLALLKK